MINIQLDNTTTVNYQNLREDNGFGFDINISIDSVPIDTTLYTITCDFYAGNSKVLTVTDAQWTKTGDNIAFNWDSFPLNAGRYTFDITFIRPDNRVITIIPGTLTIIKRNG